MHNNWRFCSSRQTSLLTGMIQKDMPILSLSRWSGRTHMGVASPLTHWGAGDHPAVLDHTRKSIFLLSITWWDPLKWDGGSTQWDWSSVQWWDVDMMGWELEFKLGIVVGRQHYQGSWRSLSSFISLANAQQSTPYCTVLYYTILYHTMLCYAILHYTMLYYTILYCYIYIIYLSCFPIKELSKTFWPVT